MAEQATDKVPGVALSCSLLQVLPSSFVGAALDLRISVKVAINPRFAVRDFTSGTSIWSF
jgi:hypothetical protein